MCVGCSKEPSRWDNIYFGWEIHFVAVVFSLFTVESLFLLYLLVISWFICTRRWCIDKLGVFHANKYLCVLIHIWIKGEVGAVKPDLALKQNILLTVPRRYFFCGSFMFFLSCACYAFVCVCLYVSCGHLLGKGWPLGSRLWCLTVSLSLSHWYPRSGVVLDCIDSWSLHPYLLSSTHSKGLFHSYTPRKLCLWWGILYSRCPSVRASVRLCVRP